MQIKHLTNGELVNAAQAADDNALVAELAARLMMADIALVDKEDELEAVIHEVQDELEEVQDELKEVKAQLKEANNNG
jgi:uncharacterized membrane protein